MDKNIEQVISLPEAVQAPIQSGQTLGEVKYILEGETIGITSIVADREVKKINLSNMTESVFFSWLRLLR